MSTKLVFILAFVTLWHRPVEVKAEVHLQKVWTHFVCHI